MKEWTTPDCRNTPSTTNLEEEEIVDALGNDGNASMPEQFNRPNPRRKMMMMMIIKNKIKIAYYISSFDIPVVCEYNVNRWITVNTTTNLII